MLAIMFSCSFPVTPESVPTDVKPMPEYGMYPFDLDSVKSIDKPLVELRKYVCYIRSFDTEYSDPWPISLEVNHERWELLSIPERIRFCTLVLKAYPGRTTVIINKTGIGEVYVPVAEVRRHHGGYIKFIEY
jgi:hypothetical protein